MPRSGALGTGLAGTRLRRTTLDLAGFTLTKVGSNTFTVANTTFTAGTINIASGTFSQYTRAHDASIVAVTLADTAGAALA